MLKWAGNFKRKLHVLGRYRHIIGVLIKYGFEELGWHIGKRKVGLGSGTAPDPAVSEKQDHRTRPQRIRMVLEELGPTFVKFGQLLSTRPDLVPADIVTELERLQDQVEPADYDRIREEFRRELGEYPENVFASFDTNPIAAGSIGQVHRAVTKEGDQVVVKIRRPGIVQKIAAECDVLEDLAGIIKAGFTEEQDTVDPQRMVREFTLAISKEVDFDNERRNQRRFILNFQDDPTIHIPRLYDNYCTEGVITMEYIDGVKPRSRKSLEKEGLDPKVVAQRGADAVLKQVFEYGFFHTDPHPGNFFVLADNVLAPIDFGQAGRIGSFEKKLFRDVVIAIVNVDAGHFVRAVERAELVDERTDLREFSRVSEELFNRYYGMPLGDIPFGELIQEGFNIMRRYYIYPPADFTLMLKSMMTIESFATSLDKDFMIFEYLKPYAKKFSLEEMKPSSVIKNARRTLVGASGLVANLPEDVNTILNKFRHGKLQMRIHHEHLENLNSTLDKSSNRLSFAVIIAALLIGSSLLVPQQGMALGIIHMQTLGVTGFIVAAIMGVWLIVSIIRSHRL